MRKSVLFVLLNIALVSCGNNTGSQSEAPNGSSPADSSSAIDSGGTVDSAPTNKSNIDTSATRGNTPVGATDGSNNTGAVGGSTNAKDPGDTKAISGTGKNTDSSSRKGKGK